MNSGSSASAPMQPSLTIATPSPTVPGGIKLSYPGEDCKPEYDPTFSEHFSKNTLKLKIAEYFGGKYTPKYIQNYLEFMHINGMITNLDYLEYKTLIATGEQA